MCKVGGGGMGEVDSCEWSSPEWNGTRGVVYEGRA